MSDKLSSVRFALLVLLALFAAYAMPNPPKPQFGVIDLRCEYVREPLGLDVAKPRLSWRMESRDPSRRGLRQVAYHLLVSSSQSELAKNRGDLWDSGKVKSSQSTLVEYAGKRLRTEEECWWKVAVTDEQGQTSWSSPARWTMGLLAQSDWHAKWIGAPGTEPQDPWLRKEFDLAQKPRRAVIHVASIGYHELYVNGKKVDDTVLAPAVADYTKRARYRTYDISSLLKPGKNVIGLWLGTGWAIYPTYDSKDRPEKPLVLAQASIDGKSEIVTDETWRAHSSSSHLLGNFGRGSFGGEIVDGNLEDSTWCAPETGVTDWMPAEVVRLDRAVTAEFLEPDRIVHTFTAQGIETQKDGSFRVDMGRNFAGWVEVPVQGKPGDKVTFQFSERADKQETYGLQSEYIIGRTGKGVFCNRFNYGSGRWLTIRGLGQASALSQIKGLQIRSSFDRAANFECSDPLLNWVYDTTIWTFENLALGGYVVDCPQRERRGYGGDAHATTQTALDNFTTGAFYTKWAGDWRDVQGLDGDLPHTAPTYSGGGGPSWGGYSIHLPWKVYEQYGDTRILKENFPMMQHFLANLESHSKDGLLQHFGTEWDFLGDWLWPYDDKSGEPDSDPQAAILFNNCYWAYALETAAKIATIVGETDAAAQYKQRAEGLCEKIHSSFYKPATHDYGNGHQNYLALALIAKVPPASERPAVWKRLEEEILVHRQGHIDAGITGGALLTRLLIDENRADLMYAMATKEDYPSWGHFKNSGQTTIPESWDNTNSQLHSSYLYVGAWFIEGLAGIRPGPNGGYQHFVLRPLVDTNPALEHVTAHYDCPYGRIACGWVLKGGKLQLDVTVPPNTRATLVFPAAFRSGIKENGVPIPTRDQPESLELAPGTYRFTN